MLVPDSMGNAVERVKLLDFGIAKLDAQSLNLEDPLTRTGALMGTPHYMSPEQCRGARGVDDRADVYSLAVIMFQMLAGRLPFIGDGGEGTVMAMHIYEQPPKLREIVPSVSEPMQDLILHMMRKEPDARPSMFLVTRRLEELGAAVGLNSELSITLEDSPPPARPSEAATLMAPPAGSAANTVLLSGSAHQSFPSQPSTLAALTGQVGQPSTLGPITGQVGAIPRYRRPLVAGALGIAGIVAVVALAVALRHPGSPPVSPGASSGPAVTAPEPPGTSPTPPADSHPASVNGPDSKTAHPGPSPRGTAQKTADKPPRPAKHHLLKHRPKSKAKGKSGSKTPVPSRSGVSVVD